MKRRDFIACLILTLGIALAYAQVWSFSFISFDDPAYVSANPQVQRGLTLESLQWAWTTTAAANWHPLTWISHELDWQIYGSFPGGHHLTSVLLHIANAILVFAIARSLLGSFWRSFALAALFAWHPLRVESVAWVSERKDVLSALLGFASILAYVWFAIATKRVTALQRYLLALLFMALSLLAKPTFVTLPFVFMLLDIPLNRWTFRKTDTLLEEIKPATPLLETKRPPPFTLRFFGIKGFLRVFFVEKIPFLVLTIVSSIITFQVQHQAGAVRPFNAIPLLSRLANVLNSYGSYVRKTLVPVDLAPFYPFPSSFDWKMLSLVGLAMVVVSVVSIVELVRRRPARFVGWWWFVGTLIPVIGLIQLSDQGMADRYTYFPSIGLCLLLLSLFPSRPEPEDTFGALNASGMAGPIVCSFVLLYFTFVQVGYWKDTRTLFTHAAKVVPDNHLAYMVLAGEDAKAQNFDQAQANIDAALKIKPDSARILLTSGQVYFVQSKYPEAKKQFEAAIEHDDHLAAAHRDLAQTLFKLGSNEEAIAEARRATELEPGDDVAWFELAQIWSAGGHLKEAEDSYRRAISINPNRAEYFNALGTFLGNRHRLPEARDCFNKALELNPSDKWAKANLAALERAAKH